MVWLFVFSAIFMAMVGVASFECSRISTEPSVGWQGDVGDVATGVPGWWLGAPSLVLSGAYLVTGFVIWRRDVSKAMRGDL